MTVDSSAVTPHPASPAIPANVSEHLANERTFLAWVRTGISLISLGIAIHKFSLYLLSQRVKETSRPGMPTADELVGESQSIGLSLILFGLLSVGLAAWRYTETTREIVAGTFRPDVRAVWIMTVAVILFAAGGLYWTFHH